MSIPSASVRNPVAVVMLFFGLCLLGYISLDRLGIDLFPDISTPKVVVTLKSADRSPQELEEKYGRAMESMLSTVNHVEHVSSVARVGKLVATVEFGWKTDMDFALLDVQKAVGYLGSDRDVGELTVSRFDPNAEPILIMGISDPAGKRSLEELRSLAEDSLKPKLERLDGVAMVKVSGGRVPEIDIRIDPYRLEALGLTAADLSARLRAANIDSAGGTIEDNEKVYVVKGLGAFRSIDDIRSVVVGYRQVKARDAYPGGGDRVPVMLADVADVQPSVEEVRNVVHLDGIEGVGVSVYKEPQRNTVLTVKDVEKVLKSWGDSVPGLNVVKVRDQARFIRASIVELEQAAMVGIFFAFLVLFVFLRSITTTIIVGLSIPLSILTTFVLMYFFDLSLNIMTLGGLALGAGMLVDNAIVVIESIFRHIEEGKRPWDAAIAGTVEVQGAIAASTLTTVVVFLPIVFVRGIAAELFKDQAFTVTFSLLASIVVAFMLIPVFASRWMRARPAESEAKVRSRFYWNLLGWCMDHKAAVLLITAAAVGVSALFFREIGSEFMPRADQGDLSMRIELPPGTRLETTEAAARRIEQEILGRWGGAGRDGGAGSGSAGGSSGGGAGAVRAVYSDIGERSTQDGFRAEDDLGLNMADIHVALRPADERRVSSFDIVEQLEPILKAVPGIRYRFLQESSSLEEAVGAASRSVSIEVQGSDLDQIRSVTETLASMLPDFNRDARRILNVRTSFEGGQEEARLHIDRMMAGRRDLTLEQIAAAVKGELSGEVVTEYFTGGKERGIRLRVRDRELHELQDLEIPTSAGGRVKLKELGTIETGRGPGKILRRDGVRVGLVTADLAENANFTAIVGELEKSMASIHLPGDLRLAVGGEEQERRRSFKELYFALALSIVLMYMVLAAQFESFVHPFTVLFTLPLAAVGAVIAFFVSGMSLNIMSIIGLIMLGGIVDNNAVILIDYINQLRGRGLGIRDAIMRAGQARVRPILMTSLTTILGLGPLVFGVGEGASLRAPMAIAVIGGLVSSTLLSLLVIPVVYALLDRLRLGRRAAAAGTAAAGGA